GGRRRRVDDPRGGRDDRLVTADAALRRAQRARRAGSLELRLPALRAGRASAPADAARTARTLRGRPLGRQLRAAAAGPRRGAGGRRRVVRGAAAPPRGRRRRRLAALGAGEAPEAAQHTTRGDRNLMTALSSKTDFKVADLSLADFGRKE